jgi:4-alpha-glucanotransferase
VAPIKSGLLAAAYRNFTPTAESEEFERSEAWWLDDYALYAALSEHHGTAWQQWPAELAHRDPAALADATEKHYDAVAYRRFEQYLFDTHFRAVRTRARALGIELMGDVGMFMGLDSADVWSRPDLYQLDSAGRPTAVAGFPPDEFSREGQVWGNALYRWSTSADEAHAWWIARLWRANDLFDIVRLDHFRGFHRYWAVPVPGLATEGWWEDGPGAGFFDAVRDALGPVQLVAEDLGPISADVQKLRVDAGITGMRVLQFGFGGDENPHLPHHHATDCAVYTGTHDNDTTLGWWEGSTAEVRGHLERYVGAAEIADIPWAMIRLAFASVGDTAIVPMQDVLRLGSDARMNTPGRTAHNWAWRFRENAVRPTMEFALKKLTATYGRDPGAVRRRPGGMTGSQ